jgi:hypothetical protein
VGESFQGFLLLRKVKLRGFVVSSSGNLGSLDDVLIVGGAVDRTSITLAIYGEDLIPEEISQLLGCEARYVRRCSFQIFGDSQYQLKRKYN